MLNQGKVTVAPDQGFLLAGHKQLLLKVVIHVWILADGVPEDYLCSAMCIIAVKSADLEVNDFL